MILSPAENIFILLNITYFVVLFEVKREQHACIFALSKPEKPVQTRANTAFTVFYHIII